MMRTIPVASLFLLIAAPSWALSFGVGCANPCGAEEIVLRGHVVCTAFLTNDSTFALAFQVDSLTTTTDADGAETQPILMTPVTVPSGADAQFPVTIMSDVADFVGEIISVDMSMHAFGVFNGVPTTIPVDEQAGSNLTVVAASACDMTTTSLATTTTSSSTTTTTLQTVLGFPRMKVCSHNGQPKKCS